MDTRKLVINYFGLQTFRYYVGRNFVFVALPTLEKYIFPDKIFKKEYNTVSL